MIAGNGIDRNKRQGITVYSGASNTLVLNTLHTNGVAKHNAYAHIDVGVDVLEVCISNNKLRPAGRRLHQQGFLLRVHLTGRDAGHRRLRLHRRDDGRPQGGLQRR